MKFRRARNNRRSSGTSTPQFSKNHSYESSGPGGKLRGTAQQLYEKYVSLARDVGTGLNADRVLAESYYQFAEHYYRILLEIRRFEVGEADTQPSKSLPQRDTAFMEQPHGSEGSSMVAQASGEASSSSGDAAADLPDFITGPQADPASQQSAAHQSPPRRRARTKQAPPLSQASAQGSSQSSSQGSR